MEIQKLRDKSYGSLGRNWCFTSFKMDLKILDVVQVRYALIGEEVCPTTGKKHLQGYARFFNSVRMTQVKKVFGDPAMHLELRKGTHEQNLAYCSKEGNYKEFGPDSPQVIKKPQTKEDIYVEIYKKSHENQTPEAQQQAAKLYDMIYSMFG